MTLNRIRTNQGRCKDQLYSWGCTDSSECDCGAVQQSVKHIAFESLLRHNGELKEDFIEISKESLESMYSLYLMSVNKCL